MKRDCFYIWLVPLVWCGLTIFSCFHSGDEHGLFAFGSIVGMWVWRVHQFDSIQHSLPAVLAAGAVVLAPFGLVLDLLRVRKKYLFILFVVLFALLFYLQYTTHGSFERMRHKNRYVSAVIVATCNLSIYATTLLAIAGGLVMLAIRKIRGKKAASNSEVLSSE